MHRILVIDDEPHIAEMIRDVLGRFGHTVTVAANGRQGLAALVRDAFDLVVTDMCMPDVDGRRIVHHIRHSERCHTPVIGISGTPWRFEQTGCDAFLTKPFRLKALADAVNHLVAQPPTTGVECPPLRSSYAAGPAV